MTGSLKHGLRAFGAEPRSPLGHIADGRHLGHAILRAAVRRRCCVVDCRCPVLGDGGEELVKKACGEKFFWGTGSQLAKREVNDCRVRGGVIFGFCRG